VNDSTEAIAAQDTSLTPSWVRHRDGRTRSASAPISQSVCATAVVSRIDSAVEPGLQIGAIRPRSPAEIL